MVFLNYPHSCQLSIKSTFFSVYIFSKSVGRRYNSMNFYKILYWQKWLKSPIFIYSFLTTKKNNFTFRQICFFLTLFFFSFLSLFRQKHYTYFQFRQNPLFMWIFSLTKTLFFTLLLFFFIHFVVLLIFSFFFSKNYIYFVKIIMIYLNSKHYSFT